MRSRTPSSPWPMPSARAATRSRSSCRRCGPTATTGSRSKATCAGRSSAARSRSCTSRSSGWRTARSRASRRWCAGTIRASAEETGLIVDLGVYVMDKTARELEAWQAALEVDPPIFASVNVSSRQLLRHDLLHDVKTVLARRRVLPGTLKLEITESLVMENPEYAAQMLQR